MPICCIKTISPKARLGLWHMTETWQELRSLVNLPEEAFAQLKSISKDKRKQEWLACRMLIQELTSRPPVVRYDTNRKPHIPDSSYQLSMSHSGDFAAIYLADEQLVGTDIQQMKPSISKGIDYFLNEEEQQWINAADNLLLHLIWSAKESAFKYAGDAELDLKKHITIKPFKSNQNGRFEVLLASKGTNQTLPVAYDTFEDYVLTWTL
ncbi:4'-phosphopantetheinyl transferase superfamily protein [Dyadobacter sp. Leaf189]|uniref:4'-phosphopantetheinyl transferase family protein n=1 Tax=Dyadobacter sp. Leaf189 TaxID=1736295 RepID=UPI0006F6022F|nr:4'-phosphopantetheinyl transferase superfamily protein [Dyadobacter sp. Leaf189]KQS34169.1 4-phosphopantetheinyl transferase [Dyadobacter sp. Leaf189]